MGASNLITKGVETMKLTKFSVLVLCVAILVAGAGGSAEANGTLKATFKDTNGNLLSYTYLYLRAASNPSPMEKYFSPADLIYGPFSNGNVSASVPAGTYKVRLTRRAQTPLTRPYGPPEGNDYTWSPHTSITITNNQTKQLGTQIASTIGTSPIIITGVVKHATTGAPLPGKYVRAQLEPCIEGDFPHYYAEDWENYVDDWVIPNYCGTPAIFPAQTKTDANGNYTILLRNPGTYYIIESNKIGDVGWTIDKEYVGNRAVTGWQAGPVTVSAGDQITMPDIMVPTSYQ